ncbi:Uncharacterised protein [Mycobacteroides abscessus subsp. abscessus]|nr:Uncharacterised protein [Mycobacteroides abscessus subsp. abscessus]
MPMVGRSVTNTATPTSTTMTIGMNRSRSISDTAAAPSPEATAAITAAGSSSFHRIGTLRAKVSTEAVVPATAASLLVPSAVAGAIPGDTRNNVGSTIRPPPPTTASTQPAAAAAASRALQSAKSTRQANQTSDESRRSVPAPLV